MSFAIRIVLQVYIDAEKIDTYLFRRRPDGTLEFMEFPSDRRIVDALMEAAAQFLDGLTINEGDETIGELQDFEHQNDDPTPDVAFVLDVSREPGGIGIKTQVFTLRSDGQLHVRNTADSSDKDPVVALMSLLLIATQLFRSLEKTAQTRAKWPITKTFPSSNGGDDV